MLKIVVHVNPSIKWHTRYAAFFIDGFKKQNIIAEISNSSRRIPCDVAILLGTNSWKQIEKTNGDYIMVNRKFFGSDLNSSDDVVALSWNGFNGHGYFCVDHVSDHRFQQFIDIKDIKDWNNSPGSKILLCGQADLGRCTTYGSVDKWYAKAINDSTLPVRVRHHPTRGVNKTFNEDLQNVEYAITLNSTVAIDILMHGTPVISMDNQSPVYAFTGHVVNDIRQPDREKMIKYLAHCQYHYSEIASGDFWTQLYPKQGKKLNEI